MQWAIPQVLSCGNLKVIILWVQTFSGSPCVTASCLRRCGACDLSCRTHPTWEMSRKTCLVCQPKPYIQTPQAFLSWSLSKNYSPKLGIGEIKIKQHLHKQTWLSQAQWVQLLGPLHGQSDETACNRTGGTAGSKRVWSSDTCTEGEWREQKIPQTNALPQTLLLGSKYKLPGTIWSESSFVLLHLGYLCS